MRRSLRGVAATLLLFPATLGLGCSGSGEAEVRGEVHLDNAPLKEGHVRFVPVDGKGPSADADVADGKFTARVPVGEFKVEITAPKVVGKRKMYDTPDSPTVDEIKELLPQRFNAQTELRMKVERGTQEKRFDVSAK